MAGYRVWLVRRQINRLKKWWNESTCAFFHGEHSYGLSTSCFWCGKEKPKS